MPARRILQLGDPLLRQTSTLVTHPADAQPVLDDLKATLAEFRRTHGFGRGISAVQIGELRRVIFLNVDRVEYSLVNPEYTLLSEDRFELWDDCFSFPDLMVRVARHHSLTLRYQTPQGETRDLAAAGAMSELIQHEMDHLDGILAVDRALDRDSFATREEWQRRFQR